MLWVECPTLDVDLDTPIKRRYDDVPREVFAKGKRLLDAVMQQVPPAARLVADAVRFRTGGRFQAEALALAKQVDANWRDVGREQLAAGEPVSERVWARLEPCWRWQERAEARYRRLCEFESNAAELDAEYAGRRKAA